MLLFLSGYIAGIFSTAIFIYFTFYRVGKMLLKKFKEEK